MDIGDTMMMSIKDKDYLFLKEFASLWFHLINAEYVDYETCDHNFPILDTFKILYYCDTFRTMPEWMIFEIIRLTREMGPGKIFYPKKADPEYEK